MTRHMRTFLGASLLLSLSQIFLATFDLGYDAIVAPSFQNYHDVIDNVTLTKEKILHWHRAIATVDTENDAIASTALPRHDSNCTSVPRLVTIRGERHSATNLLRMLINKNSVMNESCDHTMKTGNICDGVLGWKHGFLTSSSGAIANDMVVAVAVRDVFGWLLSMFSDPYDMVYEKGSTTFSTFLRGGYTAPCSPHEINCTFPMESASNLIHLRSKKYWDWVTYLSEANDRGAIHGWSLIRNEDIAGKLTQEETISSFLKKHCIQFKNPNRIRLVTKRVSHSTSSRMLSKLGTLQKFTVEELIFVLENLDMTLETNVLGYNYAYVLDHISMRLNGTAKYNGPPQLSSNLMKIRLEKIKRNIEGKLPGRDMPPPKPKNKTQIKDFKGDARKRRSSALDSLINRWKDDRQSSNRRPRKPSQRQYRNRRFRAQNA